MIRPKPLLAQLARLHAKQAKEDSSPTVRFEGGDAIFSTHVTAAGHRRGVGFRFRVPVSRPSRLSVIEQPPLPDGVFEIGPRALDVLKGAAPTSSSEAINLSVLEDTGKWLRLRVGRGGQADLPRVDEMSYPVTAWGDREVMGAGVMDELFALKNTIRLKDTGGKEYTPDDWRTMVRIGPGGTECTDGHRAVFCETVTWPDDLFVSGAHLQRAEALARLGAGPSLVRQGRFLLLTGENWELAMPLRDFDARHFPDIASVQASRPPVTAALTFDLPALLEFMRAGRSAGSAMKAQNAILVFRPTSDGWTVEYSGVYKTDSDDYISHARAIPVDPWLHPEIEHENCVPPEELPALVGVKPNYFLEAARYLSSSRVTVEFAGRTGPVFLHSGTRSSVLMPVNIKVYGQLGRVAPEVADRESA